MMDLPNSPTVTDPAVNLPSNSSPPNPPSPLPPDGPTSPSADGNPNVANGDAKKKRSGNSTNSKKNSNAKNASEEHVSDEQQEHDDSFIVAIDGGGEAGRRPDVEANGNGRNNRPPSPDAAAAPSLVLTPPIDCPRVATAEINSDDTSSDVSSGAGGGGPANSNNDFVGFPSLLIANSSGRLSPTQHHHPAGGPAASLSGAGGTTTTSSNPNGAIMTAAAADRSVASATRSDLGRPPLTPNRTLSSIGANSINGVNAATTTTATGSSAAATTGGGNGNGNSGGGSGRSSASSTPTTAQSLPTSSVRTSAKTSNSSNNSNNNNHSSAASSSSINLGNNATATTSNRADRSDLPPIAHTDCHHHRPQEQPHTPPEEESPPEEEGILGGGIHSMSKSHPHCTPAAAAAAAATTRGESDEQLPALLLLTSVKQPPLVLASNASKQQLEPAADRLVNAEEEQEEGKKGEGGIPPHHDVPAASSSPSPLHLQESAQLPVVIETTMTPMGMGMAAGGGAAAKENLLPSPPADDDAIPSLSLTPLTVAVCSPPQLLASSGCGAQYRAGGLPPAPLPSPPLPHKTTVINNSTLRSMSSQPSTSTAGGVLSGGSGPSPTWFGIGSFSTLLHPPPNSNNAPILSRNGLRIAGGGSATDNNNDMRAVNGNATNTNDNNGIDTSSPSPQCLSTTGVGGSSSETSSRSNPKRVGGSNNATERRRKGPLAHDDDDEEVDPRNKEEVEAAERGPQQQIYASASSLRNLRDLPNFPAHRYSASSLAATTQAAVDLLAVGADRQASPSSLRFAIGSPSSASPTATTIHHPSSQQPQSREPPLLLFPDSLRTAELAGSGRRKHHPHSASSSKRDDNNNTNNNTDGNAQPRGEGTDGPDKRSNSNKIERPAGTTSSSSSSSAASAGQQHARGNDPLQKGQRHDTADEAEETLETIGSSSSNGGGGGNSHLLRPRLRLVGSMMMGHSPPHRDGEVSPATSFGGGRSGRGVSYGFSSGGDFGGGGGALNNNNISRSLQSYRQGSGTHHQFLSQSHALPSLSHSYANANGGPAGAMISMCVSDSALLQHLALGTGTGTTGGGVGNGSMATLRTGNSTAHNSMSNLFGVGGGGGGGGSDLSNSTRRQNNGGVMPMVFVPQTTNTTNNAMIGAAVAAFNNNRAGAGGAALANLGFGGYGDDPAGTTTSPRAAADLNLISGGRGFHHQIFNLNNNNNDGGAHIRPLDRQRMWYEQIGAMCDRYDEEAAAHHHDGVVGRGVGPLVVQNGVIEGVANENMSLVSGAASGGGGGDDGSGSAAVSSVVGGGAEQRAATRTTTATTSSSLIPARRQLSAESAAEAEGFSSRIARPSTTQSSEKTKIKITTQQRMSPLPHVPSPTTTASSSVLQPSFEQQRLLKGKGQVLPPRRSTEGGPQTVALDGRGRVPPPPPIPLPPTTSSSSEATTVTNGSKGGGSGKVSGGGGGDAVSEHSFHPLFFDPFRNLPQLLQSPATVVGRTTEDGDSKWGSASKNGASLLPQRRKVLGATPSSASPSPAGTSVQRSPSPPINATKRGTHDDDPTAHAAVPTGAARVPPPHPLPMTDGLAQFPFFNEVNASSAMSNASGMSRSIGGMLIPPPPREMKEKEKGREASRSAGPPSPHSSGAAATGGGSELLAQAGSIDTHQGTAPSFALPVMHPAPRFVASPTHDRQVGLPAPIAHRLRQRSAAAFDGGLVGQQNNKGATRAHHRSDDEGNGHVPDNDDRLPLGVGGNDANNNSCGGGEYEEAEATAIDFVSGSASGGPFAALFEEEELRPLPRGLYPTGVKRSRVEELTTQSATNDAVVGRNASSFSATAVQIEQHRRPSLDAQLPMSVLAAQQQQQQQPVLVSTTSSSSSSNLKQQTRQHVGGRGTSLVGVHQQRRGEEDSKTNDSNRLLFFPPAAAATQYNTSSADRIVVDEPQQRNPFSSLVIKRVEGSSPSPSPAVFHFPAFVGLGSSSPSTTAASLAAVGYPHAATLRGAFSASSTPSFVANAHLFSSSSAAAADPTSSVKGSVGNVGSNKVNVSSSSSSPSSGRNRSGFGAQPHSSSSVSGGAAATGGGPRNQPQQPAQFVVVPRVGTPSPLGAAAAPTAGTLKTGNPSNALGNLLMGMGMQNGPAGEDGRRRARQVIVGVLGAGGGGAIPTSSTPSTNATSSSTLDHRSSSDYVSSSSSPSRNGHQCPTPTRKAARTAAAAADGINAVHDTTNRVNALLSSVLIGNTNKNSDNKNRPPPIVTAATTNVAQPMIVKGRRQVTSVSSRSAEEEATSTTTANVSCLSGAAYDFTNFNTLPNPFVSVAAGGSGGWNHGLGGGGPSPPPPSSVAQASTPSTTGSSSASARGPAAAHSNATHYHATNSQRSQQPLPASHWQDFFGNNNNNNHHNNSAAVAGAQQAPSSMIFVSPMGSSTFAAATALGSGPGGGGGGGTVSVSQPFFTLSNSNSNAFGGDALTAASSFGGARTPCNGNSSFTTSSSNPQHPTNGNHHQRLLPATAATHHRHPSVSTASAAAPHQVYRMAEVLIHPPLNTTATTSSSANTTANGAATAFTSSSLANTSSSAALALHPPSQHNHHHQSVPPFHVMYRCRDCGGANCEEVMAVVSPAGWCSSSSNNNNNNNNNNASNNNVANTNNAPPSAFPGASTPPNSMLANNVAVGGIPTPTAARGGATFVVLPPPEAAASVGVTAAAGGGGGGDAFSNNSIVSASTVGGTSFTGATDSVTPQLPFSAATVFAGRNSQLPNYLGFPSTTPTTTMNNRNNNFNSNNGTSVWFVSPTASTSIPIAAGSQQEPLLLQQQQWNLASLQLAATTPASRQSIISPSSTFEGAVAGSVGGGGAPRNHHHFRHRRLSGATGGGSSSSAGTTPIHSPPSAHHSLHHNPNGRDGAPHVLAGSANTGSVTHSSASLRHHQHNSNSSNSTPFAQPKSLKTTPTTTASSTATGANSQNIAAVSTPLGYRAQSSAATPAPSWYPSAAPPAVCVASAAPETPLNQQTEHTNCPIPSALLPTGGSPAQLLAQQCSHRSIGVQTQPPTKGEEEEDEEVSEGPPRGASVAGLTGTTATTHAATGPNSVLFGHHFPSNSSFNVAAGASSTNFNILNNNPSGSIGFALPPSSSTGSPPHRRRRSSAATFSATTLPAAGGKPQGTTATAAANPMLYARLPFYTAVTPSSAQQLPEQIAGFGLSTPSSDRPNLPSSPDRGGANPSVSGFAAGSSSTGDHPPPAIIVGVNGADHCANLLAQLIASPPVSSAASAAVVAPIVPMAGFRAFGGGGGSSDGGRSPTGDGGRHIAAFLGGGQQRGSEFGGQSVDSGRSSGGGGFVFVPAASSLASMQTPPGVYSVATTATTTSTPSSGGLHAFMVPPRWASAPHQHLGGGSSRLERDRHHRPSPFSSAAARRGSRSTRARPWRLTSKRGGGGGDDTDEGISQTHPSIQQLLGLGGRMVPPMRTPEPQHGRVPSLQTAHPSQLATPSAAQHQLQYSFNLDLENKYSNGNNPSRATSAGNNSANSGNSRFSSSAASADDEEEDGDEERAVDWQQIAVTLAQALVSANGRQRSAAAAAAEGAGGFSSSSSARRGRRHSAPNTPLSHHHHDDGPSRERKGSAERTHAHEVTTGPTTSAAIPSLSPVEVVALAESIATATAAAATATSPPNGVAAVGVPPSSAPVGHQWQQKTNDKQGAAAAGGCERGGNALTAATLVTSLGLFSPTSPLGSNSLPGSGGGGEGDTGDNSLNRSGTLDTASSHREDSSSYAALLRQQQLQQQQQGGGVFFLPTEVNVSTSEGMCRLSDPSPNSLRGSESSRDGAQGYTFVGPPSPPMQLLCVPPMCVAPPIVAAPPLPSSPSAPPVAAEFVDSFHPQRRKHSKETLKGGIGAAGGEGEGVGGEEGPAKPSTLWPPTSLFYVEAHHHHGDNDAFGGTSSSTGENDSHCALAQNMKSRTRVFEAEGIEGEEDDEFPLPRETSELAAAAEGANGQQQHGTFDANNSQQQRRQQQQHQQQKSVTERTPPSDTASLAKGDEAAKRALVMAISMHQDSELSSFNGSCSTAPRTTSSTSASGAAAPPPPFSPIPISVSNACVAASCFEQHDDDQQQQPTVLSDDNASVGVSTMVNAIGPSASEAASSSPQGPVTAPPAAAEVTGGGGTNSGSSAADGSAAERRRQRRAISASSHHRHNRTPFHWTKLRLLGKGTCASVYEGVAALSAASIACASSADILKAAPPRMAVKVVTVHSASDARPLDPLAHANIAAMKYEISLLSRLNHPRIVRYYGAQLVRVDASGAPLGFGGSVRHHHHRTAPEPAPPPSSATSTEVNACSSSEQLEIFLEFCDGGNLSNLRAKFLRLRDETLRRGIDALRICLLANASSDESSDEEDEEKDGRAMLSDKSCTESPRNSKSSPTNSRSRSSPIADPADDGGEARRKARDVAAAKKLLKAKTREDVQRHIDHLEHCAAHQALPLWLARRIIRQVVEGLCYLHSRGIIHRDVKCDNVLVASSATTPISGASAIEELRGINVKLADFGCSKHFGVREEGPNLLWDAAATGLAPAPPHPHCAEPEREWSMGLWSFRSPAMSGRGGASCPSLSFGVVGGPAAAATATAETGTAATLSAADERTLSPTANHFVSSSSDDGGPAAPLLPSGESTTTGSSRENHVVVPPTRTVPTHPRFQSLTPGNEDVASCSTLLYTVCGTAQFMAPEVVSVTGEGYGLPADVWSVGCMLLELLGRTPWGPPFGPAESGGGAVSGDSEESFVTANSLSENQNSRDFRVMIRIARSEAMPDGVPRDCPPMLQDFFARCFERDPKRRATCKVLLEHPWLSCEEGLLGDAPPHCAESPACSCRWDGCCCGAE